jgi:hypothetical protein
VRNSGGRDAVVISKVDTISQLILAKVLRFVEWWIKRKPSSKVMPGMAKPPKWYKHTLILEH